MLMAGSIVLDDFKPPRGQVQDAPLRPRGGGELNQSEG
jgi:hypothetical protein